LMINILGDSAIRVRSVSERVSKVISI
jgi:hypothetical protein